MTATNENEPGWLAAIITALGGAPAPGGGIATYLRQIIVLLGGS